MLLYLILPPNIPPLRKTRANIIIPRFLKLKYYKLLQYSFYFRKNIIIISAQFLGETLILDILENKSYNIFYMIRDNTLKIN